MTIELVYWLEENASPCCPQLSSNHPVSCASRSPPLCTSVAEMHKREGIQSTLSKQRPSVTIVCATLQALQITFTRRTLADPRELHSQNMSQYFVERLRICGACHLVVGKSGRSLKPARKDWDEQATESFLELLTGSINTIGLYIP